MIFECDLKKDGCGWRMEVNLESVKNEAYIQCAQCGRFMENPFYEEDPNKKSNYIG